MSFNAPTIYSPSNPEGTPTGTTTGKTPQQPSDITIIRDLQNRVTALEAALNSSQGITFVSEDGTMTVTLTVNSDGNPVWTIA